jgi:phosphoserine phosphatase
MAGKRKINASEIGKDILDFDAKVMFMDLNRTCTYPEGNLLNSVSKHLKKIARHPLYSLRWEEAYLSAYLRDVLSDIGGIGIFKPAVFRAACKAVKPNKEDVDAAELNFYKKYQTPYITDLIGLFKETGKDKKVILTTMNVYVDPAMQHFGFDDKVSNEVKIVDGKVKFDFPMLNCEHKLNATKKKAEEYGTTLKKSIFVGNGFNDESLMEECGLGISSGQSVPHVEKFANYNVRGKYGFGPVVRHLKEEMLSRGYQPETQ